MPVFWFQNVKQALARGETECFASIWCLGWLMSALCHQPAWGQRALSQPVHKSTLDTDQPNETNFGHRRLMSWRCTNL